MSEEREKQEQEEDVEAHVRQPRTEGPQDDDPGFRQPRSDDDEDDVEAHVRQP